MTSSHEHHHLRHAHAATVLKNLGTGVGILSAAAPSLTDEDWSGLSKRVGHVRLCGGIVEPLIDWSTCPGATRRFKNDSLAVATLRRSRHFTRFKASAEAARRAGLAVVLNPMHKLHTLEISADTLRWVWLAMLAEFADATLWPTDRVVFELVNEPGNYHNHTTSTRFVELLPQLLSLVATAQPERALIVGGEMGYRAGGDPNDFVNSGPAIILDAPHIKRLAHRYPQLIATFHFYRPRAFTNIGFPEISVPQSRWLGQPSDVADLATQFDEIHGAFNGSGVPIYLGEFGLNVDFIPRLSDGVAWLTAVRQLSEARGIGWAFWTYYLSPKAATTSHTAAKRLMQWDCSVLCAALFGGQVRSGAEHCPPRNTTAVRADGFAQSREWKSVHHVAHSAPSRRLQAVDCNDRRPLYAIGMLG